MFGQKTEKAYDLDMIRDFLDHLLWELRNRHYEHAHPRAAFNQELAEPLARYCKKYGTRGLLGLTAVDANFGELPKDERHRLESKLHRVFARNTRVAIEMLEGLRATVFEEAFACAPVLTGKQRGAGPAKVPVRVIPVQEIRDL